MANAILYNPTYCNRNDINRRIDTWRGISETAGCNCYEPFRNTSGSSTLFKNYINNINSDKNIPIVLFIHNTDVSIMDNDIKKLLCEDNNNNLYAIFFSGRGVIPPKEELNRIKFLTAHFPAEVADNVFRRDLLVRAVRSACNGNANEFDEVNINLSAVSNVLLSVWDKLNTAIERALNEQNINMESAFCSVHEILTDSIFNFEKCYIEHIQFASFSIKTAIKDMMNSSSPFFKLIEAISSNNYKNIDRTVLVDAKKNYASLVIICK